MAFGRKKKKEAVKITLNKNQFCSVIEDKAKDVTKDYCIIANAKHYTLLSQDGQEFNQPRPDGGAIYPFSPDPTKPGTKRQKKQFHFATVVCLSKDFNFKVFWGTKERFILEDTVNHKPYAVGANGLFYVKINPSDAALAANMFYGNLLSQREGEENFFDPEELSKFLSETFVTRIGAKIQEYIRESGRSLANFVGLMPEEMVQISNDFCSKATNIFASEGLTVIQKLSADSILQKLIVDEVVRN